MDLIPDAGQLAVIDATRSFVESRFQLSDPAPQLDEVRWKEIAELGWLGLGTDEESGGASATLLDEVLVFREIGRGLVCGPVLTTLVAARLAAWSAATDAAQEMIAGHTRVARAIPLPGRPNHLLLLDAVPSAFTLIIDEEAVALHSTPPHLGSSPGLEDRTSISSVHRSELGPPEISTADRQTVSRIRRIHSILTSAQLAGIAGATRDLATEYAKDRNQFGKPIGAFQAIKHKCADMAINALAADNVTFFAALTEATAHIGSNRHALAAAAYTRRAAFVNSRLNLQIHGAMGFTTEDSAHRFVKRTHALNVADVFAHPAAQLGALPAPDSNEEVQ
jgi:alkylation response protein AidB-like acyl-CoA dehydrogenase